jgi:hypothetical protein
VYEKSYEFGLSAEDRFAALMEQRGNSIRWASQKDNIQNHIDIFVITSSGSSFSVDIKAQKKSSRSTSGYLEDEMWVELTNVQGQNGWLYGKADYIAQEVSYGFWCVKRVYLVKLVKHLMQNKVVSNPEDALYSTYTRKGRSDKLTRIRFSDFDSIENNGSEDFFLI